LRRAVRRNGGQLRGAALVFLAWVRGRAGTTAGVGGARRAEGQARQDAAAADDARRQARAALQTLSDKVIGGLLGKQPRLGDREKQFLRDVRKVYEEVPRAQGGTDRARGRQAAGCLPPRPMH